MVDENQVSPPRMPHTPVVPVPAWPTNVDLADDHVIIAGVISPGTFHVHFYADRAAYEAMLQKLAEHAPYSQRLVGLRPGRLGMIMEEDVWHRVKVVGFTSREAIEVECVDLGRSIIVLPPNKRWLREMPKDLAGLPVFGKKCSLLLEPFAEHWCQRGIDQIGRLEGSVCEGRLAGPVDGASQTYIELWFDGLNVADDLARQGLGQRLRAADDEEEEDFVLDPCSRVKVENVTGINNFLVTFLNHRLLSHIREFPALLCSFVVIYLIFL
jgi:Tudor domain